VVRTVAGRLKVTAAVGELREENPPPPVAGLTWLKWGLAGAARDGFDWRSALRRLRRTLAEPGLVAVAYGDWERAAAPPVDEVCALACADGFPVLLLDTWQKDGSTLVDWVSRHVLQDVCARCAVAGVRVALAGSLGPAQWAKLLPFEPWFFAVRGAACEGGVREGRVDPRRVRQLIRELRW